MERPRILILDGYVDEPSLLGVPPYLSTYPRYIYGALKDALDCDIDYLTIDQFRKEKEFDHQGVILISGCIVPGKYLGGRPISDREILEVTESAREREIPIILVGGKFSILQDSDRFLRSGVEIVEEGDPDAAVYEFFKNGEIKERPHTQGERAKWSQAGGELVTKHPGFPKRLIAEIETYRGCVRFVSGGCAFCCEPAHGKPDFRPVKEIVNEIEVMYTQGLRNFRIGGQSCILSYGSKELGTGDVPKPDPTAVEELFSTIRRRCPDIEVLHVDNANPAIIAEHPEEAREIARTLVKYCSSGNVIAFGLESADPVVKEKSNLNATTEQTLEAIKIINEMGKERGRSGMPKLLPGLNFLAGLPGETKDTYRLNKEFLNEVLKNELWVRRTNIRQVLGPGGKPFTKVNKREFIKFKEFVGNEFDNKQLEWIAPKGTVLKNIHIEKHDGNNSFGRQIGTYPLLVGFNSKLPFEEFDGMVTGHGQRSITCIRYPIPINSAKLKELSSIPGIGKKRAATIVRYRPFNNLTEVLKVLELQEEELFGENLFSFEVNE